jgi:hypothetical protein
MRPVLRAAGLAAMLVPSVALAEPRVCEDGSVLAELAPWSDVAVDAKAPPPVGAPTDVVLVCFDPSDPRCSSAPPAPERTIEFGHAPRVVLRDALLVPPATGRDVDWPVEEAAPAVGVASSIERPPRAR